MPSAIKINVPGTKQFEFLYGIIFSLEHFHLHDSPSFIHSAVNGAPSEAVLIFPLSSINAASAACIIIAVKYKKSFAFGAIDFKSAATFANRSKISGSASLSTISAGLILSGVMV